MKKTIYFLITNIFLIFNLLLFWSIRSMWSGIISLTAKPVPYILCLILAITVFLSTAFHLLKKRPIAFLIWGTILNVLFFALNGYMIFVTIDALPYFIHEFLSSSAFIVCITMFVFLCFYPHNINFYKKKWIALILMVILFIAGFLSVYDIQLTNAILKTPVVYAVEDTYQITFTTQAKGEAWVVINGVEYNDTFAGGRKTENTVHKISVPMSALDASDSYTVSTRAMILRGPYESLQGPTISKTFSWKGVSTDDGINYYVISDTHLNTKSPVSAASYWGDKLDFLIALGDTTNWMQNEHDLTRLLYLASDITNGEIPVIYARGNHETYGAEFDHYHNYVGADGENFYYTFRLKNIWGIVLDLGVDHEDEFAEYAGTAKYNAYREEQTQFLDQILANAENEFLADGIDYRIGICHIPVTFSKVGNPLISYKNEWITRLNQMQLSIMYSGHLHDLMVVDANLGSDTTLTLLPEFSGKEKKNTEYVMSDANFPSILVSKRGTEQIQTNKENYFDKSFIGVAASVEKTETILRFTSESGNVIPTISPWFENVPYGTEIHIEHK